MKYIFNRNIVLPASGEETFFLWGPRQAGKSTLLRERYPRSRWLDLLKADEFRRYVSNPEFLRQEIEAGGRPAPGEQIVIDEIQKVPALLDEVHWLIENRRLHFALCGSSARKVRRGAANLLGGRALRYELHGLTAEAKASARIASHHLRGLRSLASEHPEAGRRVVVCLEPRARRTDDGIDILPANDFVRRLWCGDLAEG